MARDIIVAAKCVATMTDDEIMVFAQRDPDVFRDVARAYVAKSTPHPVEFFGGDDDLNCILKPIKE